MLDREIVYIETSVVSYLAARPSQDVLVAAHQVVTRRWWDDKRRNFHLVASRLVKSEAGGGDLEAATKRLALLEGIQLLPVTDDATALAEALVRKHAMPERAIEDALHVAIAAASGAHYLLTWNCRHIANAMMRDKIGITCRSFGFRPPVLCTPLELMEDPDDLA